MAEAATVYREPVASETAVAHRHEPRTYEEKVQHALDVVTIHLQEENPDRIDECIRLYTEDAIWEAPARLVIDAKSLRSTDKAFATY